MKLARRTYEVCAETMRDQFNLIAFTKLSDGEGGYTYSQATSTEYWGSIDPLQGSRSLQDSGINFSSAAMIYTRYTTDITVDNRIQIDGLEYTIHSVLDYDSRKQYLKIICYRIN